MLPISSAAKNVMLSMTVIGTSLGFILFPQASNWFNSRAQNGEIVSWVTVHSQTSDDEQEALLAAAEAYNQGLLDGVEGQLDDTDPNYRAQLLPEGSRVMAQVVVPTIGVSLPVFHGTDDDTLDLGIGHLYGTSLPVGGEGTHTVLTAHSGVRTNRLFNDLHDLNLGDVFMINTAGRRLYYQVESIEVVGYDDRISFVPDPERDLATLITCTPIGINSHRLLVRGTRIENPTEEVVEAVAVTTHDGGRFPTWALAWLLPTSGSGVVTHLVGRRKQVAAVPGLDDPLSWLDRPVPVLACSRRRGCVPGCVGEPTIPRHLYYPTPAS